MIKNYELGYGKQKLTVGIDEQYVIAELVPNKVEPGLTDTDEVRRSMENPIGTRRLNEIARGKTNVVIITSDITRPCPSDKLLPSVLDELCAAGIELECITVVFATGSHRIHTPEEKKRLVGERVFAHIRCIDADPSRCIRMGVTSRGTPVELFEEVVRADLRICLGNIEYHYFAGYSGGYKAIMPGTAARDSIQSNHSFMTDPSACAGRIEGNPVREDIEEAGKLCPVDFIVNVVLDEKKEIIRSFAGHPVSAHREGCRFLDALFSVKIPRRADIVLVTAGGYPKDINMYQAQKALDNAGHAVRDGGIIIWAASCTEGLGDSCFAEWMTTHERSSDMIKHIRENFVLGGHKATAIAMLLERTRIMLISELEPDFVRGIFLEPHASIDAALTDARHSLGDDASIIIMPFGGSTLPIL